VVGIVGEMKSIREKTMAKKLIEGKTRKSKTKKMSHTGGNSRPLADKVRWDGEKWVNKILSMESRIA